MEEGPTAVGGALRLRSKDQISGVGGAFSGLGFEEGGKVEGRWTIASLG